MENKKVLLSTLWLFATLNYLYCDLMGLMDKELLRGFLEGNIEGMIIDEYFLFYAALLMEIPIAMVLLSRILKQKANRWSNIIAGSIKSMAMIMTLFVGTTTLYYGFFAAIEITTTLLIVYMAIKWKKEQKEDNSTSLS